MIINLETGENCQATLRAEVPAETVTSERNLIATQFVKEAKIPGFRKGKVPLKVVQKRYGKAIKTELEKRLSSKVVNEATKKENIRILQIRTQNFAENLDETISLTADLILMPTFNMPDYKGITATVPTVEVTDERVDTAIDMVRKRHADYITQGPETPLEMGMYAVISFTATADGEPVTTDDERVTKHFFNRENSMLLLADKTFLEGFSMQLVGHKTGDNVKFKFILPGDFLKEPLQGKEVEYNVTINEVKKEQLPEPTDEWVKEVSGDPELTLETFKTAAKEELLAHSESMLASYREKLVLKQLLQQVEIDLPSDLVKNTTQERAGQMVRNFQSRGMSDDDIKGQEAAIIEVSRNEAKRDLKTNFLLREIARLEGLTVSSAEITQRIRHYADQANIPIEKAFKSIEKSGRMESVAQEILFAKTMNFIIKNAQFNTDDSTNILDASDPS